MREVQPEDARPEGVPEDAEIIDVAIVGGGPSGVYTAWRLQNFYPYGEDQDLPDLFRKSSDSESKISITLIEGSDRIGGRLESLVPPGMPHLRAEFGGMGFSTNHVRVAGLVNYLGLPTENFVTSTPESIYFLRNVFYRASQATDPSIVPYNLPAGESGKTFDEILVDAGLAVVPDMKTLSDQEWWDLMYSMEFQGRPMYEHGFWDIMLQEMSNEAYRFIEDSNGHMPFFGEWNAAEAFPWNFIDTRAGTQLKTIPTGYEQMITNLYDIFVQNGGNVRMQTRLKTFYSIGNYTAPLMQLVFEDGSVMYARNLILAMPRRSLELIAANLDNMLAEPAVKDLIETVKPIPHLKIFTAYDTPWWNQVSITDGHSNTDLPLRTIYYIGTESQEGGDPNNHNSLLMASYTDGRYVTFWDGVDHGDLFTGNPNPWVASEPGSPYWGKQPITVAMKDEIQRQLKVVHQLDNIPDPYTAAWRDWGEDPFGGAWNTWNIGVKAPDVMNAILQPDPTTPLLIVGSAYSHWQGWVEGALETAEMALQQKYQLPPPPWGGQ